MIGAGLQAAAIRAVDDVAPLNVSDPLARSPWTPFQKCMVGLVSAATMLDGLDNLLLGTVIPSLMAQWHLERSAFIGLVALSIVGMCGGTASMGFLGDRLGRKPVLIACVFTFGCATLLSAAASSLGLFTLCRFVAAIGLGGLFPSAVALVSEFTPLPRRNLAATFTQMCVPAGGLLGALLATAILPHQGWRALCAIGGALAIGFAVLLLLTLHESPKFLLDQPARRGALLEVLRRCRIDAQRIPSSGSPKARASSPAESWRQLLSVDFRRDSLSLWVVLFCNYLVVYGMFNWGPSLITAAGFTTQRMTLSFTLFNAGSIAGCVIGGWSMDKFGSRWPSVACVALGVVCCASFSSAGWPWLSTAALMWGMLLLGAIYCGLQAMLYALAASVYPPTIRASGVGTAFGIGRLGAVGSALFGAGALSFDIPRFLGIVSFVMVVAGIALATLRRHSVSAETAAKMPPT